MPSSNVGNDYINSDKPKTVDMTNGGMKSSKKRNSTNIRNKTLHYKKIRNLKSLPKDKPRNTILHYFEYQKKSPLRKPKESTSIVNIPNKIQERNKICLYRSTEAHSIYIEARPHVVDNTITSYFTSNMCNQIKKKTQRKDISTNNTKLKQTQVLLTEKLPNLNYCQNWAKFCQNSKLPISKEGSSIQFDNKIIPHENCNVENYNSTRDNILIPPNHYG